MNWIHHLAVSAFRTNCLLTQVSFFYLFDVWERARERYKSGSLAPERVRTYMHSKSIHQVLRLMKLRMCFLIGCVQSMISYRRACALACSLVSLEFQPKRGRNVFGKRTKISEIGLFMSRSFFLSHSPCPLLTSCSFSVPVDLSVCVRVRICAILFRSMFDFKRLLRYTSFESFTQILSADTRTYTTQHME